MIFLSVSFFSYSLSHSPILSISCVCMCVCECMASKLTHAKQHPFIFGRIWSYPFLWKTEAEQLERRTFHRILIEKVDVCIFETKPHQMDDEISILLLLMLYENRLCECANLSIPPVFSHWCAISFSLQHSPKNRIECLCDMHSTLFSPLIYCNFTINLRTP